MLIGSSRPKTHIRRTSSMRGLANDDVSSQNPTTIILDHHQQQQQHQSHYHQAHNNNNHISHDQSDFISAIISPRHHHNRRNSGVGFNFDKSNFLRTCGLCRRPLAAGRDLYMYMGDTAFCSEECREEQMKRDGNSH